MENPAQFVTDTLRSNGVTVIPLDMLNYNPTPETTAALWLFKDALDRELRRKRDLGFGVLTADDVDGVYMNLESAARAVINRRIQPLGERETETIRTNGAKDCKWCGDGVSAYHIPACPKAKGGAV